MEAVFGGLVFVLGTLSIQEVLGLHKTIHVDNPHRDMEAVLGVLVFIDYTSRYGSSTWCINFYFRDTRHTRSIGTS
jgi:hypothetical protein